MKKRVFLYSIVIIFVILFTIICGTNKYKEQNIDINQYLTEKNIVDFKYKDGFLVSTSIDPSIMVELEKKINVYAIQIEYPHLSEDNTTEIHLINKKWYTQGFSVHEGINTLEFNNPVENVDSIRFDLTTKENVKIKVDNVVINPSDYILRIFVKKGMLYSLEVFACMYFIFKILDIMIQRKFKIKKIEKDFKNILNNSDFNNIIRLSLKCTLLASVALIALYRSDFRYIDDIGRTLTGSYADWNIYSRFFSTFISNIISTTDFAIDISPFSQIITIFMMSISFSIIYYKIFKRNNDKDYWIILASIPFLISPYFLENISYKIECVIHGVTVLLSVLPIVFSKCKKTDYFLISTVCITLVCITYQGAMGIYPMVVIMNSTIIFLKEPRNREFLSYLFLSILAYGIGLIIFKTLLMVPVQTHVSSEIFSIKEMIPGVLHNLLSGYNIFLTDMRPLWLYLMSGILILYLIYSVSSSKINKVVATFVSVCSLLFMAAVCFGIYPMLRQIEFYPRTMYEIFILFSMIELFVITRGSYISKTLAFILSWCFIVFALEYGNCLKLQSEYTDVKFQAVINYLNENIKNDKNYVLQMKNYIGYAPSIQNQVESNKYLKKIVPQSFGGGWCWAEYKLYKYYDLSSNIELIWGEDTDRIDLSKMNLPLKTKTMWFNVYTDESYILIEMN